MRDTELAGLARTLSLDHGITITVSGEHSYCSTEAATVNIARMPATALGRQLMCGLVYHEVGHQNHTTGDRPEGILGELTNVIEDIRIERLTLNQRPGSRYDLEAVTNYYTDKNPLIPVNVPQALLGLTMASGRGHLLGQKKMLTQIQPCSDFLAEIFAQPLVDQLMTLLMVQLPKLTNTAESLQLAEELLRLIRHQNARKPKNNQPQALQASEPPGESGPESCVQGSGEEHQHTEALQKDSTAAIQSEQKVSTEEIESLLAGDSGDVGDMQVFLTAELDSLSAQTRYSERVTIPEYPEIEPRVNSGYTLDATAALIASSRMRHKLPQLLQGLKQSPISYGCSGKKLASSRLISLATGNPKIFKRKQEISALNTAVMILLDNSGSMYAKSEGHSLYEVANQSAFALHHCLSKMTDITVASIAFTDMSDHQPSLQMLCDFKQKPDTNAFALLPSGGTPIDKALWYARAALLQRHEQRKVILLLTDGEPNSPTQTQTATNHCQNNNIEIIALGILTDAVKKYWSRSTVIGQLDALPATLFQVMGAYWQANG